MGLIDNASLHGGPKNKEVKLGSDPKHYCGTPMWKWVTKYIYIVLPLGTLWILSWIFFLLTTIVLLYRDCPVTQVDTPPVSPTNVEGKAQAQEKASVSNTLVNHGEISVSIPTPNPASTPPPSPEAEVIKKERRITRGIIPHVQQ
jgi:hypothetical protein